jgi:Na+-translocating ferredoxin:NAD+ oxidoreductase RnfD subunit
MPDAMLPNPAHALEAIVADTTIVTAEEAPVRLAHGRPTSPGVRPTLLHSGMDTSRFFAMHVTAALFPITAGLLLYGWRAALTLGVVVGSTAAGIWMWRRCGWRGAHLRFPHALWLALLLGLMLPAHLATTLALMPDTGAMWAILLAAGLALSGLIWLLGGVGSGRVHPLLLAYLLVAFFFQQGLLSPSRVLQRNRLVLGDTVDAVESETPAMARDPWISGKERIGGHDAILREPVGRWLVTYTNGREKPLPPGRAPWTIHSLLRDHMPPLEDLIVGGQPGPIGASSAIAVIIGGLFLLYRGLIDFRIPLLIVLSAYLALLVLPLPVQITEAGAEWHWLVLRHETVGWPLAVTLVNYEVMASPLLFTAFFLASAPAIRPMARRARAIYAVLIGLMAAALQLYVSVDLGPYIALLTAGIFVPLLDKHLRPRALV